MYKILNGYMSLIVHYLKIRPIREVLSALRNLVMGSRKCCCSNILCLGYKYHFSFDCKGLYWCISVDICDDG